MSCLARLSAVLVVVYSTMIGSSANAQQNAPGSPEALRAEQDQLFEQMFKEPDNLELMFRFATVSIKLQDYEAAISTLERMLIYRQDLTRVRLELAVAYFNLGSYGVSELYFDQVLADPETSDTVRQRVARYKDAIAERTAPTAFSLVANLGITYSTNANLGPSDNSVIVGGIPGFVLDPGSQSQSDFGARWLVYGGHAVDLGRPNNDAWLTDFSVFGLRYFDVEEGNTLFARLRTGPRLAVSDRSFGPTLRPYVEGSYLNGGDRTIYFGGVGGLEFAAPLTERWSAFGDLNLGYFNFEQARDLEDRFSVRFIGGGAYKPNRNVVGRISGIVEYDNADANFNSNVEIGARLSGEYRYDSGFAFVDRKWSISAYADARYRWFDSPDPAIAPLTTRNEVDLRGGLSHLFAIQDGFGFQLDVEGFLRDANISNFDLDNVSVTLSAQYRL